MVRAGWSYAETQAEVGHFYSEDITPAFREEFLHDQAVDGVYCIDRWPVTAEAVAELEALTVLDEVASAGRGALFRAGASNSRE
jgi:hypothetical protein